MSKPSIHTEGPFQPLQSTEVQKRLDQVATDYKYQAPINKD